MGTGKLHAVIVDDDMIARTLLRGILRSLDVAVDGEATNARRGLALVQQFAPDLVCLDIGLPDMDGGELLVQVRTECPTARVVMVTSTSDSEKVRQMVAGGARGYIVKPYTGSTVRATVARLFPDHKMD